MLMGENNLFKAKKKIADIGSSKVVGTIQKNLIFF